MRPALLLSILALVGCAAAPVPPPAAPTPPAPAPAPAEATPAAPEKPADPFALEGSLREEPISLIAPGPVTITLDKAPKGVAPAPKVCAEYAKRKATGKNACGSEGAMPPLDTALAESGPARRDALLADVEACAAIPPGLVRALRAELAPRGCADVLVEPLLEKPNDKTPAAVQHALAGLALGARLARTVGAAPKLAAPYDRARVAAHLKGPMRDWIVEQVAAVEAISRQGVSLAQYGKAVVAIEAGLAEMRFVEAVRSGPIPDEFLKDGDLKNMYFSVLDEALEPRKARGRDAALVALRELAFLGVLHDDRVDRARKLLSELYGGRRIDALDGLLLPPLPPAQPTTAEERVAAKLPTFYASVVVPPKSALRPGTLRALLDRGLPPAARLELREAPTLPNDVRLLFARARLDLGRLYWRAYDFDRAAALASDMTGEGGRPPEATLLLAVAAALRGGPEDVAQVMRRAPLEALGLGKVTALDAIAGATPPGPFAGMAAFDAAYVRELAAPQGADAAYFRDVSARFRKAAELVADPKAKAVAEDRAKAAEATAAAIK
jgi:hypothetical protein